HWPITATLAESKTAVYALGADRPRKILMLHAGRGLAGSITLTGDEPSPVRVVLQPAPSIRGRALDRFGAPLSGSTISLTFSDGTARELYRFSNPAQARGTTSDKGVFEIGNPLPGENFEVVARSERGAERGRLKPEHQTLAPGESKPLGD